MGHMSDLFLPASMVSLGAAVGIAVLHHDDEFKIGNLETKAKGLNTVDVIILGIAGLVVTGAALVEYLDYTAGVSFDYFKQNLHRLGQISCLSPSNHNGFLYENKHF